MCSSFNIKITRPILQKALSFDFPNFASFDAKVLPHKESIVITRGKNGFELRPMSFSLTPSWSKEPRVKFSTHNARIETLEEKPTWRGPLKTNRCLVPLTSFIEPIYTGSLAGNMVAFGQVQGDLLVAAGLWDLWTSQETGEIKESFAIVTTAPPEFVLSVGHDRCPVFLQPEAFEGWLDVQKTPGGAAIDFLRHHQASLNLQTGIERPLAKGWEKRVSKP